MRCLSARVPPLVAVAASCESVSCASVPRHLCVRPPTPQAFRTCFSTIAGCCCAAATGVACALELQRFGFEVVVIEAQNEVGGRCQTLECNGVDIGASWIHGFANNPLIRELYRYGLSWSKFGWVLHSWGDGRLVVNGGEGLVGALLNARSRTRFCCAHVCEQSLRALSPTLPRTQAPRLGA